MRAERLLTILLLLQRHGRMTAQHLADKLNVSERTIYRDIDALALAGIPVFAEKGPHGGFGLVDGYRTRLTGLTETQVRALMVSGDGGPLADLGLDDALRGAVLKFLAAVPDPQRERLEQHARRVYVDATPWFADNRSTSPHLSVLQDAVFDNQRVTMTYDRGKGAYTQDIEPYGLVTKDNLWYVVAKTQRGMRTFRVSRIVEVKAQDSYFVLPDNFDLAAYWQQHSRQFERSIPAYPARVRFRETALDTFKEWFILYETVQDYQALLERAEPSDVPGWCEVTMHFDSLHHARMDLLMLGDQVQVVEPAELRDAMRDIIQPMATLYE